MSGPFAGIRIIDLSNMLMGPVATQLFGDYGADVIKVEPIGGDAQRRIGPGRHEDMCSLFLTTNRNKRSVELDLKTPAGRQALLRLAASADVLFYNIRPQAMARLGLAYDDVRAVNPQIVYCGAYGFAQSGPYAARPAYDDLIQAGTGIAYLNERMNGKPTYAPFALVDHLCGVHVAFCLSAALYHRKATGQGQAVEVPMFETMTQTVFAHHLYGRAFDPPMGEAGYPRQISPYRRPYRTLDGHLGVMIVTDAQWQRFFDAAGLPHLKDDPRFRDLGARTVNTDELYSLLERTLSTRTSGEWLDILAKADVPAMRMRTLEELLADEHLNATGFIRKVEHPTEGTLLTTGVASNWSVCQPDPVRLPVPRPGEHTVEVLRELGMTDAEIAALRRPAAGGAG